MVQKKVSCLNIHTAHSTYYIIFHAAGVLQLCNFSLRSFKEREKDLQSGKVFAKFACLTFVCQMFMYMFIFLHLGTVTVSNHLKTSSSRSKNPLQLQNIKTTIKLYYRPLYILSLIALFLTRMCHYALKISCKLSLAGTSLQICAVFRSLSYRFLLSFTSDSSKFCTWWRGLTVRTYLSYQTCLCLVVFSQVP